MGRRNQIALETAAQGQLRPGPAVRHALAHDLDALQRLSVTETTLVNWVSICVQPRSAHSKTSNTAVSAGRRCSARGHARALAACR